MTTTPATYADPTTAPVGTPVWRWSAPDADGKRTRRYGVVIGYVGQSMTVRHVGGGTDSAPYAFKTWIVADLASDGTATLYAATGAFGREYETALRRRDAERRAAAELPPEAAFESARIGERIRRATGGN